MQPLPTTSAVDLRLRAYMALPHFYAVQLRLPDARVISHFGCAAKGAASPNLVLCLSHLNGRFRISMLAFFFRSLYTDVSTKC